MDKYNELRNKYDTFIYEGYTIEEINNKTLITYIFNVPNLIKYSPTIEFQKFSINSFTKYLIFHIGLVELISYWKATCSKNVIIKAGYLNEEQINWFKKLYYHGLGELFYINGIKPEYDDFMNITCVIEEEKINIPEYNGIGNLIPICDGKDSNVTLELLSNDFDINDLYIINPKDIQLECAKVAGYQQEKIKMIKRTIDKNLIELNKKGFINGHTPFSALVAFTSFFNAYINNKKYIILSNESSAN